LRAGPASCPGERGEEDLVGFLSLSTRHRGK